MEVAVHAASAQVTKEMDQRHDHSNAEDRNYKEMEEWVKARVIGESLGLFGHRGSLLSIVILMVPLFGAGGPM
jgi:hypothetical protein